MIPFPTAAASCKSPPSFIVVETRLVSPSDISPSSFVRLLHHPSKVHKKTFVEVFLEARDSREIALSMAPSVGRRAAESVKPFLQLVTAAAAAA